MRLCLATIVTLGLVTSATAQPLATPPSPLPAAPAPAVRSESTATLLSVGGTLAGYGLLFATGAVSDDAAPVLGWTGFALAMTGPSLGHVYAGEPDHAVITSLGRAGGAGLMFAGAIYIALDDLGCEHDCGDESPWAYALVAGGGGVLVGLTIYDLADAHKAARRRNERAERLRLAPTTFTASTGARAYGLGLSGTF